VGEGDLQRIFSALGQSGARYLVVGGVAVVLHGHPRFTADLDLVIALDFENVGRVLGALQSLGYRPRAPVPAEQLADPEIRKAWIEEKGLTVFSMWSAALPATEVDLFVKEPFPFDEAYRRGVEVDLDGTHVVIAAVDDLVRLKRAASRPRDLEDIAALEAIARMGSADE
jgi:hypothetical protein